MATMRSNRHHPPSDSARKLVRKNEATSWRWQSFSFPEAVKEEPTSPKVGCMGQIRKEKMSTSVAKVSGTHHKFFKLKKMFSGKSFGHGTTKTSQGDKMSGVLLPVGLPLELDPPLPVNTIGTMKGIGDAPVCLWKRRCWIKLERLQLQNLTPRLNCSRGVSA